MSVACVEFRLLALFLVLSTTSCSIFTPNSLTEFKSLSELSDDCQAKSLAALSGDLNTPPSFSATSSIAIDGVSLESFRQNIVFSNRVPAALRIDFFATEMQKLIALIRIHQGLMDVILPNAGLILSAEDSADSFYTLLRIPLSAGEFGAWLAGKPDMASRARVLRYANTGKLPRLHLTLEKPDGRKFVYLLEQAADQGRLFCGGRYRVKSLEVFRSDSEQSVFYSRYSYQPQEPDSLAIRYRLREESIRGEIAVNDITSLGEMSTRRFNALFERPLPSSYGRRPLDRQLLEYLVKP